MGTLNFHLVLIPAILAVSFSLFVNFRGFLTGSQEFKVLRLQVSLFSVIYLVLFLLREFQLLDPNAYIWIGTGLSVPVFYFVWSKPALVNIRVANKLKVANEMSIDTVDKIKETLDIAEHEKETKP